MLRRAALALTALALAHGAARGQTTLQWKFKEGDRFYVEEKMVSKNTTVVAGTTTVQEQTETRISSFLVKNRTKDGVILEQRIESWKTKVVKGQGAAADGTSLLQQAARDVAFTVHLSPAGAVTKFEGHDQFLRKMAELDKDQAERIKALATDALLRAPLSMVFDVLPTTAVHKGDTWTKESVVPLDVLGNFKFATTFSYAGEGEGDAHITSKGTYSFEPSKTKSADLGIRIVKVRLTTKQSTGKLVFDATKGRLISNEVSMPVAGTMTFDVMGQLVDAEVEGTVTRTVRRSDKRPTPDL